MPAPTDPAPTGPAPTNPAPREAVARGDHPAGADTGPGRPWFEDAFGPLYLDLYPHRDRDEADRALAMLAGVIGPALDAGPVLDIACGSGRYLEALHARRTPAVGLDLSRPLLKRAAEEVGATLVRGDMRHLPFRGGAFAVALSMFTSLGYFASPADDALVLAEAARVVRPGGHFVLDYLNAGWTRARLVPEGRRTVGLYDVVEQRRIAAGPDGFERVEKTMRLDDGRGGVMTVREEVLLLGEPALVELLEAAGFVVCARLGDYEGHAWDPLDTPRCLLVAQRTAS